MLLEANRSWTVSDVVSVLLTRSLNPKLPTQVEEFSEADSEENVEYKDIGSLQISKLIMLIDIQIIIKIVFIS